MKRFLSILAALTLVMSMGAVAFAEDSGMSLGLYVNTTAGASTAAGETDGTAQIESVAAAVLLDAEGKIADVDIDAVQSSMPFTAEGKLGAEFPSAVSSRKELGDAYGMSAVSQVGEWYQQIDALCAYLVGKTADEVANVAMDESAHPTDTDLTAGCTMSIGGFLDAVVGAMENAQPCDANATDKVGLGISTDCAYHSKDATADANGQCQAYSFFAAATTDEAGAVTACRIDSTQGTVTFDAAGAITSDVSVRTSTKQELGDDYGMRAASGIGKEWYEQANAFADFMLGKTLADVQAVAMDETTHATDADLIASVTVSIGGLKTAVVNAVSNAK